MPFNNELELDLIKTRPRKKGQGRRASSVSVLHFRRLHYRFRPPESNNAVILWGLREKTRRLVAWVTELNFGEGSSREQ